METASVPQAGAADLTGVPETPPQAEQRVSDLARETAGYASAWLQLAVDEAALARANLVRLLVVGLLVPAMATGVIVGLDALGTALLQNLLHSWSIATAIVSALNIVLLLAMLWLLRRWSKSLSLPRSRAAFNRLWSAP